MGDMWHLRQRNKLAARCTGKVRNRFHGKLDGIQEALGAEIVGEEKGKGVVGAPFVGMPSSRVANHTLHKPTKFDAKVQKSVRSRDWQVVEDATAEEEVQLAYEIARRSSNVLCRHVARSREFLTGHRTASLLWVSDQRQPRGLEYCCSLLYMLRITAGYEGQDRRQSSSLLLQKAGPQGALMCLASLASCVARILCVPKVMSPRHSSFASIQCTALVLEQWSEGEEGETSRACSSVPSDSTSLVDVSIVV